MPLYTVSPQQKQPQGSENMLKTNDRLIKDIPLVASLLFISAGLYINYIYLSEAAFIGFHHHDWAFFWDAGWRIFKGQHLYKDFDYYNGPVHPSTLATFFFFFGAGKAAILAYLYLSNAIVFLMTFFLCHKKLPLLLTMLMAALSLTSFSWLYPHPYHDYTAHLIGIIGIYALGTLLTNSQKKQPTWEAYVCGAAALTAFFTKINIGGLYGLLFLLVIVMHTRSLKAFIQYCAGNAMALSFFLFLIKYPAEFLRDFVSYSSSETSRVLWLTDLKLWMQNYYWLILLSVILGLNREIKKHPALFTLFTGVGVTAILAMLTSSTFKTFMLYRPLIGIYIALGLLLLYSIRPKTVLPMFFKYAAITVLVFTAIFVIKKNIDFEKKTYKEKVGFVTDYRMGRIRPENRYYLKSGSFKGWLHHKVIGSKIDGIYDFIQNNIPKDDSFLILSRMLTFYTLTERDSYRNVPIAFEMDVAPRPGKRWHEVREMLLADPPDWILTYIEEEFKEDLNADIKYMQIWPEYKKRYRVVKSWDDHAILKRKY